MGTFFDALIPFQIGLNLLNFDVGQGTETKAICPPRPH